MGYELRVQCQNCTEDSYVGCLLPPVVAYWATRTRRLITQKCQCKTYRVRLGRHWTKFSAQVPSSGTGEQGEGMADGPTPLHILRVSIRG